MITDATQFVEMVVRRGDLDLVHATREGDMSAFEQLVLRYDRKLFRIAQNITHNREDSEDAVQESFLKAFQSLDAFDRQMGATSSGTNLYQQYGAASSFLG